MTTVVLVHGWGLGPDIWRGLHARMEGRSDMDALAWDLGFTGGVPAMPLPRKDGPVVAMGHSLGALWLLHERPFVWDAFVSVNGFARFPQGPDFPEGVPRRQLEAMIARFPRAPQAVAEAFLKRCGASPPPVMDRRRMARGLAFLRDWDARAALGRERRLLALAGTEDPIVPPAMSADTFPPDCLRWVEGGHLLPESAPDACLTALDEVTAWA